MKSKGQTCEDILERHFFVQQGNRRCAPETLKQAKTFPCSTNQANDPLNLVHDHFKKNTCVHLCLQGNKKNDHAPKSPNSNCTIGYSSNTRGAESSQTTRERLFRPKRNKRNKCQVFYPLLSVFAAKICTSS